jgi:hypothetical protein
MFCPWESRSPDQCQQAFTRPAPPPPARPPPVYRDDLAALSAGVPRLILGKGIDVLHNSYAERSYTAIGALIAE